MFERCEFVASSEGLKNPSAQILENDFEFIVGDKKYPCNSYFAEFLSPKVAEIRSKDPTVNKFVVEIDDPNQYFNLAIKLMRGYEVECDIKETIFLRKVGVLLGNKEIIEAFSLLNNKDLTNEDVIPTLLEKIEFNCDISAELSYIVKHFFSLNTDELLSLDLDIFEKVFSSPKLMIESEDSLFKFITKLIDTKGEKYKNLLKYIKYEGLTSDCNSLIDKYITTETIHQYPELWEKVQQRLFLKTEKIRTPTRYIKKEIIIPFTGKEFEGIFKYLRDNNKGQNPIEARIVDVTIRKDECKGISPSALIEYSKPPCKWYLAEHDDNYICFDFKTARVALSAYTLSSGADSSYWEYPVSYAWEGSSDGKTWEMIDNKKGNTDMNGNQKTHTWTLEKMSPLYRYLRFRLTEITRKGGLYTSRVEFYGAYEPPI